LSEVYPRQRFTPWVVHRKGTAFTSRSLLQIFTPIERGGFRGARRERGEYLCALGVLRGKSVLEHICRKVLMYFVKALIGKAAWRDLDHIYRPHRDTHIRSSAAEPQRHGVIFVIFSKRVFLK
jgi:hypothetical protein